MNDLVGIGHYCSSAIPALRANAASFRARCPATAQILEKIASDMVSAPKFLMPTGGQVLGVVDEGREICFDLFRIPYPITVVEYRYETDEEFNEYENVRLESCPHRIAVAYDLSVPQNRIAWSRLLVEPIPEDGVMVWPVNGFVKDRQETWDLSWIGVAIPAQPKQRRITTQELRETDPGKLQAASTRIQKKKTLGEVQTSIFLCGEVGLIVANKYKSNGTFGFCAQRDTAQEMFAVVDLGIALSCRNVETERHSAPQKLNKKRERNGKQPFFDYHVLVLDVPGASSDSSGSSGGGTHKSPKAHLRRGHIRRLESAAIWVNATVVNAANSSVIKKDYRVKSA